MREKCVAYVYANVPMRETETRYRAERLEQKVLHQGDTGRERDGSKQEMVCARGPCRVYPGD